jgi:hypothetical protein
MQLLEGTGVLAQFLQLLVQALTTLAVVAVRQALAEHLELVALAVGVMVEKAHPHLAPLLLVE